MADIEDREAAPRSVLTAISDRCESKRFYGTVRLVVLFSRSPAMR